MPRQVLETLWASVGLEVILINKYFPKIYTFQYKLTQITRNRICHIAGELKQVSINT